MCEVFSERGYRTWQRERAGKKYRSRYLEIANAILVEAEEKFGRIDRRILFPLADHISFAVERIRHGEQISNPLTEDIRALFGSEYQVASKLKEILKERLSVEIDSHEIGYVALHIHRRLKMRMCRWQCRWQEQFGNVSKYWSRRPESRLT